MKRNCLSILSTIFIFLIFWNQNAYASEFTTSKYQYNAKLLALSIECSGNSAGGTPWHALTYALATDFTIQGHRYWEQSKGEHKGDVGQHILTGSRTDKALSIYVQGKWLKDRDKWEMRFMSMGNKSMLDHLEDGVEGYQNAGIYRRECKITLENSVFVDSALHVKFHLLQVNKLRNQVSKLKNEELDNIEIETKRVSEQYEKIIDNLNQEISNSKNNLEFEEKFEKINKKHEDLENKHEKVQQEKSNLENEINVLKGEIDTFKKKEEDLENKHEKVQQEKSNLENEINVLKGEIDTFKKKEEAEIKRKENEEKEKLLAIKQEEERIREEERKKEERKNNNLKYELGSSELIVAQILIRDLEEFVKQNPSEFDIVEIAELLIENRQILDGTWNDITANSLVKLKDYLKNSENFNQFYNQKEEDRYNKSLAQLNQEYESLLSSQKELENILNENLTSEFAPLIVEKIKIIRNVLKDYTFKLLINTNLEISAFKENLSKEIEEEKFEEGNKITEIEKINKNLLKLEQLLVDNLTNDYAQLIIEKIHYLKDLNTDILDSKGLRDINLDIGEFISKVESKPLTEAAQSNNNKTNAQLNSENQNEIPKGYDTDVMFNVLMGEQENSIDVNNSEEGIESNKKLFRRGSETQEPLALEDNVLTKASDKEVIEEMKTFYVDSCNQDLELLGDPIEISTAMCKCVFDSIMDAGLTEEELFGTDGMYEIYQAIAKGTHDSFTEIESKIVDIQMDSVGDCMLETNYFNYLYDLPIKE